MEAGGVGERDDLLGRLGEHDVVLERRFRARPQRAVAEHLLEGIAAFHIVEVGPPARACAGEGGAGAGAQHAVDLKATGAGFLDLIADPLVDKDVGPGFHVVLQHTIPGIAPWLRP